MTHEVVREHRYLDKLFDEVRERFASGESSGRIGDAFEQLSDELRTHFEQEDRLYFPAILALQPDMKASLDELTAAHGWFCDQLRRVGDHLRHEDPDGALEIFREVGESFRRHEEMEEQLLVRLDADLQG